ncbi:MAG: hypothetical protein HQ523_10335 [Lentisphaerae bacterium]|nr:hypothetical protein [Lentisphaerota bacterium]
MKQKLLAAVMCIVSLGCAALGQTPDIVAFQGNGVLTWSNALPNQAYEVQWASTLTGTWFSTWSFLDNVSSTSQIVRASVPMFYRVSTAPHIGLLTEIFSSQSGCNAYVTTNTDSSYDSFEREYHFGPVVSGSLAQNATEHDNSSSSYDLVKQFTDINALVHRTENQLSRDGISGDGSCCKVEYHYADASIEEAIECENAPYYEPHTYYNGQTDKIVDHIDIYLRGGNQHGYEKDDVVFGFTEKPSTMIELALPVLTGHVTHTLLNIEPLRRDVGDRIEYEIYDGVTTESNLLTNTKNEIVNLSTNPTLLRVVLFPSPANPLPKTPAIKSLSFSYWYRP